MPQYGKSSPKINKKSGNSLDSKLDNLGVSPREIKVPQKDLLIFFRQLAVIVQSGVPLAQGIELLAENTKSKKFSLILYRISNRLSAGEQFSICLKTYPKLFAPITVGLIEAGEAGGILDKVLERIASLIEDQEKIKSQINGALIYPVLILVLSITVSLGLLIFIVPRFELMFSSFGADLPALTAFMLSLSRIVVSPYFAIITPLIIFLLVFLYDKCYKTKKGRVVIDSFILQIPLFGSLFLRSEMASLCDTLSTLLNSGIPLVEGLERCISASSNQIIKNTLKLGIIKVERGQELSSSLDNSKVLPKLVISMLKIGEETGELSFMLENLTKFYKREVETAVSSLTKAMEPAVIMVVAAIVGTIVVSLYLPMFKIITAIG